MRTDSSVPEEWYNKAWLVILLCIVFFPVGLYALWKSQKFSKGWKIAGTIVIGLVFIAALNDKDEVRDNGKSLKGNKSIPKAEKLKSKGYLFETADDFKNAFNDYTAANDFDLRIDDLEVKEGEVNNTFMYMFTPKLGLIGSINKSDGGVKEITTLSQGDGTFESGSDILICMIAVIASVDPSLKAEKRGDILKELGLFGDSNVDINNLSRKTTYNGIKYFIASNQMTGMIFGASRE